MIVVDSTSNWRAHTLSILIGCFAVGLNSENNNFFRENKKKQGIFKK